MATAFRVPARPATAAGDCFLGVTCSVAGNAWRDRLADGRSASTICQSYDIPDILGRILAARGVAHDTVEAYLSPTLRTLMPDPATVVDMEAGAERIAHAIATGEPVGLIGDYDVDGCASAALLAAYFRHCGRTLHVHIPDRLTDGYGPDEATFARFAAEGVRLVVTVDCGIAAHAAIETARRAGLDVVVVDHHPAGELLPAANAVINPNRLDDLSGLGALAAVGVTFILVAAVNRRLRQQGLFRTAGIEEPDLLRWLDLVALGTVCDVVPLTGLNRALVAQGLKVMAARGNPGLAALCEAAGLRRRPDVHAAGFLLGPRINAAGRLGRARLGYELMVCNDRGRAVEIARALDQLNRERQAIEERVLSQAEAEAERVYGSSGPPGVIVLGGAGWHAGVLGLVASRLKERYDRPVFAIGFDSSGVGQGSGRSVPGVDLGAAVRAAQDGGLLVKGGGHAMAAGLTVEHGKINALRAFLEDWIQQRAPALGGPPSLALDGSLSAGGASLELLELVERAGPYGSGNPEPRFVFPAHRVVYPATAGRSHVRCRLVAGDGSRIEAIAFRALGTPLGEFLLSERSAPAHVAGRLVVNDWGGPRRPQLLIDDAAPLRRA